MGLIQRVVQDVLMSADAVQYEFIWLHQAPVNQPKGGVDMTFVWYNPHTTLSAAILHANPISALRMLFWVPLPPQWKRQDKSISQRYNLRHFLACRVINRLIFPLSYVTWENETVRRWKVRALSTAGLYKKCLTEWKDGWRRDRSEISQWAELSPIRRFQAATWPGCLSVRQKPAADGYSVGWRCLM